MLDKLLGSRPRDTYPAMPQVTTALTQRAIADMNSGIFNTIAVNKLVLKGGENCIYCDYAVAVTEKLQTVGNVSNGGGFSVRVCRGVTYRFGNRGNEVIRDVIPKDVQGKLYITNKRIVFSAEEGAFSMPLAKVISYQIDGEMIIIQFDKSSKKLYLPTASCAINALKYAI
ncbi:MAG: hypothetical protein K2K24_04640 [Clostridia bacterium]|nr:hypothetical protein [Clostridia bacterium]